MMQSKDVLKTKEKQFQQEIIKMIQIKEEVRINSHEFGKAGNRFKIYYNEVSELIEHLAKLKNAKLIGDDE